MLPREDLDDAIAAGGDDKAPVLAPDYAADAFAAHDAMRGDLLCTDALVERPESDGGVVACRDGFTAVFAK